MLTYEDLAKAPTRIDLDESNYDHAKQIGNSQNMVTFNGTRTYDFSGKPNDSDQD